MTDSTNTRARELAGRGAAHGTLVTASEQTAGRGRQGRAWVAPPESSLLCSVVIRDPPRLLSLAAGVAVAEAAGPSARVKWPNDVLLDGKKLAGILVEGRPQERWAVLGIGVNVALDASRLPPDLRETVATLGLSVAEVERVLSTLLRALERSLAAAQGEVLAAVRGRDALYGQPVRWSGGSGTADGIDDDGRLIVRTASGMTSLEAGEVHLQR